MEFLSSFIHISFIYLKNIYFLYTRHGAKSWGKQAKQDDQIGYWPTLQETYLHLMLILMEVVYKLVIIKSKAM
jgi:hypothetical protein